MVLSPKFRANDHLARLTSQYCQNSSCKLSSATYRRTKTRRLAVEVVAPALKESLKQQLGNEKFSLLVDETTEQSAQKQLEMVVRHLDRETSKIVDDHLECNAGIYILAI